MVVVVVFAGSAGSYDSKFVVYLCSSSLDTGNVEEVLLDWTTTMLVIEMGSRCWVE